MSVSVFDYEDSPIIISIIINQCKSKCFKSDWNRTISLKLRFLRVLVGW